MRELTRLRQYLQAVPVAESEAASAMASAEQEQRADCVRASVGAMALVGGGRFDWPQRMDGVKLRRPMVRREGRRGASEQEMSDGKVICTSGQRE